MLKKLLIALVLSTTALTAGADDRPNVLFIAIDDMNDWAGFLDTHPQIRTPAMDALAASGVSFTNAHVPAPICGPSRTAIMSGMWPTSTGVYTNAIDYREDVPHLLSMPEHFRNNGYRVMGVGKLFHAGLNRIPENAFDEYGEYGSSSQPFAKEDLELAKQDPFHRFTKNGKEFRLPLNGFPADRFWRSTNTFDWGAVDLPDEEFSDYRGAEWAAGKLREEHDRPFFLAVGFHRPHQPLYNPKRFHDMYPLESVVLPPTLADDLGDVPRAGREYALAPNTSGLHRSVAQYGEWEHAVSSYLASISFVDELIGNIMRALEESAYADNTLVVMWSDHGWHLGEKEHWGKATGWFRSTRIPMIIVPPGSRLPEGFTPGAESTRPVNLLDLAPTIAGMTGVPPVDGWEGKDLAPLVADPDGEWQGHTHTTFGLGNHTVSTERWQYIHYFDGSEELYDLLSDPDEFVNLAGEEKYAGVKERLSRLLPEEPRWKRFVRYHNFKAAVPADGSPTQLYDLAWRNDVNEQNSVAKDYPHIVAKVEQWLAETQPASKFLVMAE
ncbi:MAG: sulfatase-like hydrolase/transferase [Xanthomonadales bacterium]|nr:sulfatase [Xanthomonadales bacterium]NIX13002.1 sulfatase-like hydrolase/transferase [Xanthomonadales bacterium]